MLKRKEIQQIKTAFNNGLSIRKIIQKYGYSYRTIFKYIHDNGQSIPRKPRIYQSKLDKYKDELCRMLLRNARVHRKQRLNIKQMWEDTLKKHSDLQISERAFRNYINKLIRELGINTNAYVPLLAQKGLAQVDFGVFEATYRGLKARLNFFVMSFPHSNFRISQVFESQNQQCFFEGLVRAFEIIGGVPTEIMFDNPSTLVRFVGNKRQLTHQFKELQVHYGFEAQFCNPAKGNEKGHVENSVRWTRSELLSPPPRIKDLDEFNVYLLQRCNQRLHIKHHRKNETIAKLFDEDKALFAPLPATRFEASIYVKCKTDTYGFVHVKTNRYSTAYNLANCQVWVKLSATTVSIYDNNHKLIVCHERRYGVNKTAILWEKYVNLLAQKPRAILHSGALPDATPAFVEAVKLERVDKRVEMIAGAIAHGVPDAFKIPPITPYKLPQCTQTPPKYQIPKIPTMT